jgi:hypothetical protein
VTGELTARVAALCDDVGRRLAPGEAARLVADVRAKLTQPLSVAVAGGVSSGKSTLVNALLGQQVAAVDAGECTRLVTWFRYDHRERIELRLRDGSVRPLAFAEGRRVPSSVGVDPEQVTGLDVYLSNSGLKALSIIDTPGLNTVTAANEATSRSFLGLAEAAESEAHLAMSQADALLFLTPQLRQADADLLAGFRELSRGSDLTALNTVGVLSKVDKLAGPGEDPLEIGARLARRAEEQLHGLANRVHPVIGLLAETAGADAFTETDARTVAVLAALDEMDVEDMLLSTGDLLDTDWGGTSRTDRARLLAMLDLYGLGVAITTVQQGRRGSAPILAELDRRSGFGALRETLVGHFGRRADQLKAHAGICDLRRISFLRGEPKNSRVLRSLRAPLEDLELDREIQALRVLDALRAYQVGELPLPDDLAAQLEQLADGHDPVSRLGLARSATPAEVAASARDRAGQWGTFGNDIRRSPAETRLARAVKQCYELLWADATTQQGAAP